MNLLKLADEGVGVQSDGIGICAHERPPEDASGPSRHIVALETLELQIERLEIDGQTP